MKKALLISSITLFLLLVGLFTIQLAQPNHLNPEQPDYTRYTIKEGHQNFKPYDNLLPTFFPKGYEVAIWFDSSAYYSQADWWVDAFTGYDRDWWDWNKGKGLTGAFSANNVNTSLIAWRSGVEAYTFEVAAYTNYPKSKFTWGESLIVPASSLILGYCDLRGGKASYTLIHKTDTLRTVHPFKQLLVARETGTWIGGADNEIGPYGGAASKDMTVFFDFVSF